MQDQAKNNNPDALNLSKQEILDYMRLVVRRWESNPKVSRMFIRKFRADLFIFDKLEKEAELEQHWKLTCEFFDGLRALNDRKQAPELDMWNPMFEESLKKKILTVEDDKKPRFSLAEALRYGAMKEQ